MGSSRGSGGSCYRLRDIRSRFVASGRRGEGAAPRPLAGRWEQNAALTLGYGNVHVNNEKANRLHAPNRLRSSLKGTGPDKGSQLSCLSGLENPKSVGIQSR